MGGRCRRAYSTKVGGGSQHWQVIEKVAIGRVEEAFEIGRMGNFGFELAPFVQSQIASFRSRAINHPRFKSRLLVPDRGLLHYRANEENQFGGFMTIKVGDKLPAGSFGIMKNDGPGSLSTDELFNGKTVVLFGVPGAYTPTCSKAHLPGFVENAAALKAKGIDTLACMAVNDVFVMDAWGKGGGADGKVLMLADGNATYTKALGLELDASGFGMGTRSQRFALVAKNGVVQKLLVEPSAGQCTISGGQSILENL